MRILSTWQWYHLMLVWIVAVTMSMILIIFQVGRRNNGSAWFLPVPRGPQSYLAFVRTLWGLSPMAALSTVVLIGSASLATCYWLITRFR